MSLIGRIFGTVVSRREAEAMGEPKTDYLKWLKADLISECESRGLATDGNKDDLIMRIVKDDKESEPISDEDIGQMVPAEEAVGCPACAALRAKIRDFVAGADINVGKSELEAWERGL